MVEERGEVFWIRKSNQAGDGSYFLASLAEQKAGVKWWRGVVPQD